MSVSNRPVALVLARRRLDIVAWATGLPAFGPEALLVQLATRPASFGPWADLVAHLDELIADCSDERLERLLSGRPTSAWQRASYLLDAAGEPARVTSRGVVYELGRSGGRVVAR